MVLNGRIKLIEIIRGNLRGKKEISVRTENQARVKPMKISASKSGEKGLICSAEA
jgi:hypothetical protein